MKHAKDEKEKNENIQYEIPNDCQDVLYLSLDQIKRIIRDLYLDDGDDDDEGEQKANEQELFFEWNQEKAGNERSIECIKEYKESLNKEQGDILMVSHGGVISDISEVLYVKILKVDECRWLSIGYDDEDFKLYSPTSVSVIFDKLEEH